MVDILSIDGTKDSGWRIICLPADDDIWYPVTDYLFHDEQTAIDALGILSLIA